MRVFDTTTNGGPKVNFVDRKNTLVGYDMDQCCCEYAEWSIEPSPALASKGIDQTRSAEELEPYTFDTRAEPIKNSLSNLDEGRSIAFRMVAKGKPELWLVLFNVHNGYYSHGFTFEVGGKLTLTGSL